MELYLVAIVNGRLIFEFFKQIALRDVEALAVVSHHQEPRIYLLRFIEETRACLVISVTYFGSESNCPTNDQSKTWDQGAA